MIKKEKNVLRFWILPLLWMGMIFIISSIPGKDLPKISMLHADKLVHFIEYFILGLLLIRAFLNSYLNLNLAKIVILSIVIATLYAILDEWHQRFVPDRTPDVLDFLADFLGLNIGIFLYNKYEQKENKCHR